MWTTKWRSSPGLSIKAAKGDAKAAKVLFDLLGDQSKTEDEVKVVIDV
ncbi:MAG: hypothetical protein ACLVDB_00785 [Anaeromassilibacillus sp.]